jgi:hypothetical protein
VTTSSIDWAAVTKLTGSSLKSEVFSILQQGSLEVLGGADFDDPALLAIVPRIAELVESRSELASFREPLSGFARTVGLWNYIDKDVSNARDEMAAEIATVPGLGIVLHREQMTALNILLGGQNLILSAPTSFGKSVLIDALLTTDRYKRVAIVLPTIALLDEFRRRLVTRFREKYDILMHTSEESSHERVIFLGTQERLINREDLGSLDLVVVDEFYKLDPSRRDERSVALNAAVYRLLNRGKQFFFLGPNIDQVSISSESRWRFSFLKTRFSTVAVDTYDLKNITNKEERLHEELLRESNWPALVFVSSPDKANELAGELVRRSVHIGEGAPLADWMETNYGEKWEISDAVRAGVGVHHGRVPRALASRFVSYFNEKKLPVLVCTSTLIEGVNTAAKSVLIYDKKIANRDYDFFTFSNIRGRAGRLGQHHVGQVYLFNAPPGQETYAVSAPLFGDMEDLPDEFVVHLDDSDATPATTGRVEDIAARLGLTPTELRRYSSIGIEELEKLKLATEGALLNRADLGWNGYPTYGQIEALMQVICSVRTAREFGCASHKQLTMYIQRLRASELMRWFFLWHSNSYQGEPHRLDNVFKFLRSAEYGLPEYCSVIETFVRKAIPRADYSLFLAAFPRWFRPEILKILEEQGVPIQISERFAIPTDTVTSLGSRLRSLAIRQDARLSSLEQEWVLSALPG